LPLIVLALALAGALCWCPSTLARALALALARAVLAAIWCQSKRNMPHSNTVRCFRPAQLGWCPIPLTFEVLIFSRAIAECAAVVTRLGQHPAPHQARIPCCHRGSCEWRQGGVLSRNGRRLGSLPHSRGGRTDAINGTPHRNKTTTSAGHASLIMVHCSAVTSAYTSTTFNASCHLCIQTICQRGNGTALIVRLFELGTVQTRPCTSQAAAAVPPAVLPAPVATVQPPPPARRE
jgi:hypothetical protein